VLVAISGSLDPALSNTALIRALSSIEAPDRVAVWEGVGELPHFRPDGEATDPVQGLRRAVATADLVLIATPEYAGGMPGSLKNALDWLVGSGELYGKPVVVVSAAPSVDRGGNARRWVEDVTRMQGATVLDSFTIPLGRQASAADIAGKTQTLLDRVRDATARHASEGAAGCQ
jgi:NAD(P)H-dependent FMN reductase